MGIVFIASLMFAGSVGPMAPRESLRASAVRLAHEIARETPAAPQQVKADWGAVDSLPVESRLRVTLRSGIFNEGRLSSVSADRLTLIPKSGTAVEIARDDIAEIRRARPSWIGGLVGVAAGGVAGFFTAVGLAFKQCGSSCGDETLLAWGSLVGMPIAGGYLGSRAHTRWTTVYRSR